MDQPRRSLCFIVPHGDADWVKLHALGTQAIEFMTNAAQFQLLLFHRDVAFSTACVEGGVDGLIVDFETKGKALRQSGYDTEINYNAIKDLEAARSVPAAHLLCRINGPGPGMNAEIKRVIDAGVDEVIVPMIKHLDEAKAALTAINGAARLTLMVETKEATGIVPALCALPVHRIYVGLNDLHIDRGTASIFEALVDGTLDKIRADTECVQFGFGGLTLPGQGTPLPVRHLVGNLARLGADFTFLRRSFYRDVSGSCQRDAIRQIRDDMRQARARDARQISLDFEQMQAAVHAVIAGQHG